MDPNDDLVPSGVASSSGQHGRRVRVRVNTSTRPDPAGSPRGGTPDPGDNSEPTSSSTTTTTFSVLDRGIEVGRRRVPVEKKVQEEEIFHNNDHPRFVLDNMNRLMNEGFLTDVTIVCRDGERIYSNSLLLSANNEYFRAILQDRSGQFEESDTRVINIPDVGVSVLRDIVDYCATSRITITQENVQDLYINADRFGFESIVNSCAHYLFTSITVENHFELWCMANQMKSKMEPMCESFMKEHLLPIMARPEWLAYPVELVELLLAADDLNVHAESQVFQGLLEWLKHDPVRREQHVGRLFPYIRLDHVSLKYLYRKIAEERMFLEVEECRYLINRQKDRRALGPVLSADTQPTTTPRETSYGGQIFVIGGLGQDRTPSDRFDVFSVSNMKWDTCPNFPVPVWGAAATIVEGFLLCSGGEGTETRDNLLFWNPLMIDSSFTPTTDDTTGAEWTELSPMRHARFGHGMTECLGSAFIIGGYHDNALSSCEVYDLHVDRWMDVAPLNFPRDGPCVVTLYNAMYAAGGYNAKDYKVVERFDPRVGFWERVPNMEQSRSYGAAATANGKIYCFGGRQKDKKAVGFVECYDPRASKWESQDSLQTEKSDIRAVTIANNVYILGGLDKNENPLSDLDCYHPTSKDWMRLPKMHSKRRLMAVASVG